MEYNQLINIINLELNNYSYIFILIVFTWYELFTFSLTSVLYEFLSYLKLINVIPNCLYYPFIK